MRLGSVAAQRNAAVLVWVPVLMAKPLVDAPAEHAPPALNAFMVFATSVLCVIAVLDSWPLTSAKAAAAWALMAATVLVGALLWNAWSPVWLLVAMTAGVALAPKRAAIVVPACAMAAAATMWRHSSQGDVVLVQGFVVALSGTTAAVLSRLIVLTESLRRTREQLAEAAVARERDRVARDLHDILGHTLSLMVVKSAAVQRLIDSNPRAAALHAADIEDVGRSALGQVRQTVENATQPTLGDELSAARVTLESAGVAMHLHAATESAPSTGPLPWVLREGITNIVRHAQARNCWIAITPDNGGVRLTIEDDGAGVSAGSDGSPRGGLNGLQRRVSADGGVMETPPRRHGFTLTAWVPSKAGGAAR